MNGSEGAPPQVIRREDGSFHVLNVDLDPMTPQQRLVTGVRVWPQIKEMLEASGEYKQREKDGWKTLPGVGSIEMIDRYAATAVNVSLHAMNLMRGRLLDRPDVMERALAGEFTDNHQLKRELGFKLRVKLEEGAQSRSKHQSSYFGHSDKFEEAIEPLVRYLRAWGNKDFRFTHVPPREAQKRVTKIEKLIEDLTKSKEDLVARSHVASYTVPSRGREKK